MLSVRRGSICQRGSGAVNAIAATRDEEAQERLPQRGQLLQACGSTAPQWRHSGSARRRGSRATLIARSASPPGCQTGDGDQRADGRPRGAGADTRLGRVAAGGAARWAVIASTRAAARPSSSAAGATGWWRRSTPGRPARGHARAAMKAGQVLSTVEFQASTSTIRAPAASGVAARSTCCPRSVGEDMREMLASEWDGARAGAGEHRDRARRRGQHRPGLPRAFARGHRGRGQGPVHRGRRGGGLRHAQPADARPGAAPGCPG